MNVDRDEARRIARLANLEFDDVALDRIASELSVVLTYVEQLTTLTATPSENHAGTIGMDLREDIPRRSLDRTLVEANAPRWRDGFFVVPRVIDPE